MSETTPVACPDCSAVADDNRHLTHDETCPLGLAIDKVVDGDRDWFLTHPDAAERHRPITPIEKQEYLVFGFSDVQLATHVQVTQIAPGVRRRHPYTRTVNRRG